MDKLIRDKLIHAVTAYDRRRYGRRGYNVCALAQYLRGVEDALHLMDNGEATRDALQQVFNDRLLDVCLRAIGEPVD